jgi:fimbrial isopeptide formation D2 family protein/uncharacterized repeat protein (TIGR01451 family)
VTLKTTSLPGSVTGERTASSTFHTGYEAEKADEVSLNGAELEKAVSAEKGTTIGSPLTYTLHLKLPPHINFADMTVEDQLPKGVLYDITSSITCETGCEGLAEGAEALNPKTVGGAQLLGWYLGKVDAAEAERVVTIVYKAHIAQELEAGVKVEDKDKLKNSAIGLYNGEQKFGTPPTEPPSRSEYTNQTNEPTQQVEVLEPKLTIAKAVTGEVSPPTKTQPGDKYTYTLTVTNSGDSAAYDVTVKDNNPQGVLRELDPEGQEGAEFLVGWTPGTQPTWQIPGPIAPGASVKLKYTAELAPSAELKNGDKIENVADIPLYFGAPAAQRTEEGAANFRRYEEDPKSTVTLETSLPKPKVEKTFGTGGAEEGTAEIGKPVTWQVKVTNQSTAATWKGVDLLDTLPKGWEYVATSAEFTPGGTKVEPVRTVNGSQEEELSWTDIANLGPEQSITLTFKAVATLELALKPGTYTNKAKASGEDASGATRSEEGPYEAEDTAKANLKTPGLTIVKKPDTPEPASEATAGETSVYSIEIHNGGTAEATEVEVTDVLGKYNEYTAGTAEASIPSGFSETFVGSLGEGETEVRWKIDSIAAGGTVLIGVPISLAPSIPTGTRLVNNASVKSAQESTPVSDEGSLVVHREAQLSIEKTTGATGVVAGETIEYQLHVANHGPSAAEDAVVTDPIPTGTELVSADSPCAEAPGGGAIVCELGELPNGFTQTYHVTLKVLPSRTGNIVNKVTLTSPADPTGPHEDEVSTPVEPRADISLVKSGPENPVLLGSTFTYTLEVENNGPSDAQAVQVEDPLPAEVEALKVKPTRRAANRPPRRSNANSPR